MPMTLPPPGRFSITSGWPSPLLTSGSMMRARLSVPPPAPNGTIRRIGRVGQDCAKASARHRAAQPERTGTARSAAWKILRTAIWMLSSHFSAATTHHKVQRATFQCERRRAARLHGRRFHRSLGERADAAAAACRDGAFEALLRLGAAALPPLSRGAHGPARARRVRRCRRRSPPLSMERLVQDTRELLDHLGLQERAHRRQFGRRLHRPAARDEFARARDEPDAVRLDAGAEEQPGADLDPARRARTACASSSPTRSRTAFRRTPTRAMSNGSSTRRRRTTPPTSRAS